jgi:hypothetical protein
MFLFCEPSLASNERRNEEKMSVFIHGLLFTWYLEGNFFYILETSRFRRFSDNSRHLFVTSITVNTKYTVTFPESFEDLV